MTSRRKWLIAGAVAFGLLIVTLVILPFALKGPIAARARAVVNESVNAQVDWSSVGLTFFRDFPNVTLGLDDLSVVGIDRFAGDTLATIGSFRVVLDARSVLRSVFGDGAIVVRTVRLERPAVSLAVLEDGTANWDIAKGRAEQAPADTAARALAVELRSLELSDGTLRYRDARTGLDASLEGLAHTLNGNFSRDSLGISTHTRAERTTVRFAGVPWLAGTTIDFAADVDADLADGRFAFRDDVLRVNDLALRFSGEAARAAGGFDVDVAFAAADSSFARILSLVPTIYANDFASIETEGAFSIDGNVRGRLAGDTLPAFSIAVAVNDGMFRYPDLPLPARAIALDLDVANPGGPADSTVVTLRRFHAEVGGDPVDASLVLRRPISDPDVDARVSGTVDLADLGRTVKLEGIQEIVGTVAADAHVRARRSDIEAERFVRIAADGTLSARGVSVAGENVRHPVTIEEASVRLSPQRSDLDAFRATIGSSDIEAAGWIENLPGFLLSDQPLRGSVTLGSRRFVLDEWKSDDPEREVIPVPTLLDLSMNATIDRLVYGALELADAQGRVTVKDQRLTLESFTAGLLGGRIGVSGYYETLDLARPRFAADLVLDSLDIRNAAESLLTVRTLAPVAQYARGSFSADLNLAGALGTDLTPLFDVLDGGGSLLTSRIALEDFPVMERLANALQVPQLASPTLEAIRSTIEIRQGRLHVRPFDVGLGSSRMLVSGSNGIDKSLDYTLALAVPRTVLGAGANRVVQDLAARAGRAGLDLAAADSIRLGVRVTGTITDPSIDLGLGDAVTNLRDQVVGAADQAIERQVDAARERLDSAAAETRRRAQARADSLVLRAEEQADAIRAEAKRLADGVRAEANRRADELVARAENPIARRAAEIAANRIRQEGEDQALTLEREADERATALVAEARGRADALRADTTSTGAAQDTTRLEH